MSFFSISVFQRVILHESSPFQQIECNKSQYKRRMLRKSKHSISKMNKLTHKNLIKRYKINFDPLLLPKLALIGYQIKNDPSFQVFLSKLQLFDKSAIQRENIFIEHMKQLMKNLEKQRQQIEEKNLLAGIEKQQKKHIKSGINFQEDKHKYGQLLTNRLTDLKQLIFHVERLDSQPIQQKQCKSILENEINKITVNNYSDKKNKYNQDKQQIQQQENKKYFKLSDFKVIQMNKRIQDANNMLKSNRFQRKFKNYKTEAFEDLKQYSQKADLSQQQLNDRFEQRQFASNVLGQLNRKPIIKRNAMVSRTSKNGFKFTNNLMDRAKTQPNDPQAKNSKTKKRQGKSVRYNLRQEQNQANQAFQNKLTQITNISSSRPIKRSDSKVTKATQNLIKSRNFLSNSKKRQTKNTSEQNEDLQYAQSNENNKSYKSRVKTVKFNEHHNEQKISYIKTSKQKRKFGQKSAKKFLKKTQSIDDLNENTHNISRQEYNIETKRQLNTSKTIRRQAFQQSQATINSISSVTNKKRKGRLLGIQANKHLQRLLMQQSIQQMVLDNQLYDTYNYTQKYKSRNNKGKYTSRKMVTDVNQSANRSKTKHDILMEVDIDGQNNYEDSTEYVSNQGFKVEHSDLKTIRQNYIQILPYHHKTIGQFYGGQHFQMINHQFNTNQHGQYFFNRLVLQTVRKNSADDYIPYDFPQFNDKYETLRLDFSKQLSKQLTNIQQIDLRQRISIISYV